ncbi:MAG: EF-hand domain-containing protein [Sphingomonadales bacterium]|nr:EF-hand domain-containing protein [Sphingomonadales bacterium]MDE2168482.1 EF-hand domain-containing protein [Sphingomonadales bacterium]
MNRIALGAVSALLLASAGFFWWQGRAEVERGAPPPDLSASGDGVLELPQADPTGSGPSLPGDKTKHAPRQTTEERRFNRFDRNRDGRITRTEMLSTRVKAFQKLDTNHDNLLTFEEWAVRTSNRFKAVDRDGDGIVSREELAAFYVAQEAAKAQRAKAKAALCSCSTAPSSDDDGD